MMNVALVSKWHVHAVDYAKEAQENESISISLIWDENKERGEQWAKKLDVPFEPDLTAVLSNPLIDGIIVTSPTDQHKEIIMAAANHGKHIFTEKVLAFTSEDCEQIFSAVEKNNVQLMVSLPRLTESLYLYAQNVVDEGLLGEITNIRSRVAHNGAVPSHPGGKGWLPDSFFNKDECGGGAFIDLGAHPIYLTNRLGGLAKSVTGQLVHFHNHEVDDNAVVLVEYASGAVGILETGFLSYGSPKQLELYGSEGTLLIEDQNVRIKSKHLGTEDWVSPDQLPDPIPTPMQQWVNAIEKNIQPFITKEDILNLTVINEAAALSSKEERKVTVSELVSNKLGEEVK